MIRGGFVMILDITPLEGEGRNCLEDVIATVVSQKGKNYELLFANAWSFDFIEKKDQSKGTIGERLIDDWGINIELIKKYNGINIEVKQYNNSKDAYDIIKENILNGKSVAFTINTSWCEWHPLYKSKNEAITNHIVLGCGIYENGDVHCIDCRPINYGVRLKLDNYIKGNNGIVFLFNQSSSLNNEDINYKDIINETVVRLNKNNGYGNSFDSMKAFAELVKYMDFQKECAILGEVDFKNRNLINKIQNISNGRRQYARMLEYVGKLLSIDKMNMIASLLKDSSKKWNIIRALFIKAGLKGVKYNTSNKIPLMINEIADLEKDILNKLSKVIINV